MKDNPFEEERELTLDGKTYTIREIILLSAISVAFSKKVLEKPDLTFDEKKFLKVWLKKTEDERIQFRMANRLIEQAPFNEAD